MYELRTITGTLRAADGAVRAGANVRIVRETAVADGDAFPPSAVAFYTDTNGNVPNGTAVAVPSSGAWAFALLVDSVSVCSFVMGAGAPITVAEILALAGLEAEGGTPQQEMLLGLYTAVSGADDGKMLETLGGDLTLVDAPEGLSPGDAAWLTAAAARVADGDDVATRDTDGTAGNLTVLDASGNAVDAGYAASQSASTNTVVRRTSDGGIAAIGQFAAGVDGRSIDNSGVYGQSTNGSGVSGYAPTTGTGVTGTSASGTGGQSTSVAGTYHHRFGIKSAIERTTGVLKFVDSTAASDRAAQRTELGLGTAALAATGDFDAAGAAAAAQAAAIQRANHTGTQTLSTISDAGTMAAAAAADYYTKTDHSATPTAAEPLKADGSGGIAPKTIDLRGATVADFTALFPGKAATAYGIQTQSSGATGGLSANGFTNATATALPVIFTAYHGSTSPTVPAIIFRGAKHNGATSAAALAFAEQLIQFRNWTTNVMTILGGGEVGIRTDTPSAQLHLVANAASKIGEIIQLAASPTANALEVRSSVGAVLAKIEPDGEIQAAGYRSSDGTAGWTGTFLNGSGATVTVKNGLITGVA